MRGGLFMRCLRRLKRELRAQKLFYFAPIALLYILVPLVFYGEVLSAGGHETVLRYRLIASAQQFLPLAAVWWPALVLRLYFEAQGSELMFVHRVGPDNLLARMLLLFCWYALHLIPHFIALELILGGTRMICAALLVQSLLFIAACYFLSVSFKAPLLALLAAIVYAMSCYLFPELPLSMFYRQTPLEAPLTHAESAKLLWVSGLSIVCLLGGFLRERMLYRKKA